VTSLFCNASTISAQEKPSTTKDGLLPVLMSQRCIFPNYSDFTIAHLDISGNLK